MRRAAKIDSSQHEIVKTLRSIGASVQMLHMVGQGCPDILVGWRGGNYLLEIKTGERVCDRKLTQAEKAWHDSWAGQVLIVSTPDEAAKAVLKEAGFLR